MSNFYKEKVFLVLLMILLWISIQTRTAPISSSVEDNKDLERAYICQLNLSVQHFENPEEQGPYLEGDIIYNQKARSVRHRWPDAVVPFTIESPFSIPEMTNIYAAMILFHTKTCVRFRPRKPTDKDFVAIYDGPKGCVSQVGRKYGRQTVSLHRPECLIYIGTIIHELMHILGFVHEQNRYDRNDFVKVLTENLIPRASRQFNANSSEVSETFGVGYDYASVMHYSLKAFSANGKPTLEVLLKNRRDAKLVGQRFGFSVRDIKKINAMYSCKERQ